MITATAPAPVEPPDPGPAEAARARLSTLEHGPTALGELADLATWAAAVRGRCPAPPFAVPRCLLLAADHGVARTATVPRIQALLDGTGAQALLARTAGVPLRLVDVGLDADPVAGVENRRIRRGSGPIDRADSLTPDEALAAVALGRQLVDEEVDSGTDLLVPAAIGADAALPATAVIATLSRTEPIWALGFGAIRDDAEWSRWCGVIRDARRRAGGGPDDAFRLLGLIGGADLAVLTGVLVQAAVRRTPVLLDGTVGAAAGLLARELAPEAPNWWRAPQRNGAAAERTALEMLQLEPSVPLGLRLGEGCGALATVPLLQTAVTALADLGSEPPAPPEPAVPPLAAEPVDLDEEPVRDDPWPDPAVDVTNDDRAAAGGDAHDAPPANPATGGDVPDAAPANPVAGADAEAGASGTTRSVAGEAGGDDAPARDV